MPKTNTRKSLGLLLALCLMPLSTGCAKERLRLAVPPIEKAAPVAYPVIPDGEAEGSKLSDRQNAGLLVGFASALDEANARLAWLRDWIKEAGE